MPNFDHLRGVLPPELLAALEDEATNKDSLTLSATADALAARATQTTEETHLYIDGDNGSDTADGTSWANAVKTLQVGFNLIPSFLAHNTIVHVKGTFSVANGNVHPGGGNFVYIDVVVSDKSGGINFCIDGGDETTDVLASQTTTATSTSTLTVGGAGWTTDQYTGYFVEVLTGPAAGELRTIVDTSSDTLTISKNFTVDPGVGATFKIYRYSTTLDDISIQETGGGGGRFFMQRMFWDRARITMAGHWYYSRLAGITAEHTGRSVHMIHEASNVSMGWVLYDADLGGSNFISSDVASLGFGQVGGTGYVQFDGQAGRISTYHSALNEIRINQGITNIYYGTRASKVNAVDCPRLQFYNDASYGTIRIKRSPDVGLIVDGGTVDSFGGVEISDNTSHGVEVKNGGVVKLADVLPGTGNGGAGLYAHLDATVSYSSGSAPTITGTVGDVAVTSPSAEEATWSAIDTAGGLSIAAEKTLIKKV